MSWRQRLSLGGRARVHGGGRTGGTSLDREATPQDLSDLTAFIRSRPGVELYVEPQTAATDTTAVAVAADGEWIRRRVGSPDRVARVAGKLAVPVYEAARVGYPRRMREWTAAHPERRMR